MVWTIKVAARKEIVESWGAVPFNFFANRADPDQAALARAA